MICIIVILLICAENALIAIYCTLCSKKDAKKINQNEQRAEDSIRSSLKIRIKEFATGYLTLRIKILGCIPSQKIRNWEYRHILKMKLGKNAVIYGNCIFRSPWNIVVGEGTVIGGGGSFDGRKGLFFGENVNIGDKISIYTLQHDVQDPYFIAEGGPVVIGDRSWLSSHSIILPQTVIGEGAVVAAGAVVCKDCEPYTIYGGVPARIIGKRNNELFYKLGSSFIPFI